MRVGQPTKIFPKTSTSIPPNNNTQNDNYAIFTNKNYNDSNITKNIVPLSNTCYDTLKKSVYQKYGKNIILIINLQSSSRIK